MSLIVYLVLAINSNIAMWYWAHVRSFGSLLLLDLLLGVAVLAAEYRVSTRAARKGGRR